MTLRGLSGPWIAAVVLGCAPRPGEPPSGPPEVHAEGVVVALDGTVLRAARGQAEGRPELPIALAEVTVDRGEMHLSARRAEGFAHGPWNLLGHVNGFCAGVLPQVPRGDAAVETDAGAASRVELSADRMRMDPRARTATLEGAVTVRRADVQVESPRVLVRYATDGRVLSAEAAGPVRARTSEGVLDAPSGARADFVAQTLTLLGRVRVAQAGAVIEGEGVEVDLASGAIEMRAVRGWLPSRAR